MLYSTARDFIAAGADGAEVYDLYSGTGTIAQVIAPAAKHVTGVEIIAEAVEAAKENAKLNGLENCDFIAGDVLKVLDDISEKPDYIILDPPRDGIHPKALDKIVRKRTFLDANSKILTLSTCTSGASNTRYLVQGVLIKDEQTN